MLKLGKKSSVDLLSGDEGWVIFKFSVPIILSYLLQQIYTISDAAICGQTLGVDDIAGVNDVFPILFIFLQFAVGCTAGFSVITSIAAGRGDQARVRRSFAAQLVLGGVLSLALTGVAVLTLKPLLRFIGLSEANPGVWRAAYQYSLVIFIGIFAQLYYNLICSVLRSLGDSTTPLIFLLFSTVLNIGLDLLFILAFRLGGHRRGGCHRAGAGGERAPVPDLRLRQISELHLRTGFSRGGLRVCAAPESGAADGTSVFGAGDRHHRDAARARRLRHRAGRHHGGRKPRAERLRRRQ